MIIKLGLIGKGHVGTYFIKLLKEREEILKEKFNLIIIPTAIFVSEGALINNDGLNLDKIIKSTNVSSLSDWKPGVTALEMIPELKIDYLIEMSPTNHITGEPALSHIIMALENGIDVISSNKGPFFLEYKKIINLSKKLNREIKFEATVASCVPIISIKEHLKATEILGINAILNGTSNYILSRMTAEGIDFLTALKEAQELGYAEKNPKLDIEGFDAAGKLVIIANELLELSKNIKDVIIKGIEGITPEAIELAKLDGYVIKSLAIVENKSLIVEPRLIENISPLNIGGTLNAIEIKTKYSGSIFLIGRGAGGFEAASAIFNDLISLIDKKVNK